MTQRFLPALVLIAAAAATFAAAAKLPAPDDAAKAKAAETAARTAWQNKVDIYHLCKVQDRIAARYGDGKQGAKSPAGKASGAAAPAASAPAPAASATAVASADKPTPAVGTPPPPCGDPGPFSYNQQQQTPLETSGAHSPAGTAVSPPSVRPEAATMPPARK
ncbi:MAG: hypothetical protein NVS2B4_09130 [Ramlibacter sp.]